MFQPILLLQQCLLLVLSAGNKERGDRGGGAACDWQTAAHGEGKTPCTA